VYPEVEAIKSKISGIAMVANFVASGPYPFIIKDHVLGNFKWWQNQCFFLPNLLL